MQTLYQGQQLSEQQALFINAVQMLQQRMVEEGEKQIMSMRRYISEFLQTTFNLATDPNVNVDIFVRQVASVEFKNEIDKNIRDIDPQQLLNILAMIVPAGTAIIRAFSNQVIANNLITSFERIFEYVSFQSQRFINNFLEYAAQLFNQICQSMDMSNPQQTEFSLRVFTLFIKHSSSSTLAELREAGVNHFYQSYIKQLMQYFINEQDLFNFQRPSLVLQTTKALRCVFEPREISTVFTSTNFIELPILVTQMFRKLQNPDQTTYQNAKEDCCWILQRYMNRIHRLRNLQMLNAQNEQFLQIWQQYQCEIAQALVEDINNCKQFDLFADYDSINSVFSLTSELIETNRTEGIFYHPEAAQIILNNAQNIAQNIFDMIINAANVRMEHFRNDDLLVIDCLRPSVDLIRMICINNKNIEESLIIEAKNALGGFMNNEYTEQQYQDQSIEARIFLGTILIRRGLPNIDNVIKGQLCLQGLYNCRHIHEIVFEEIAKLIIQITYDEYNPNNFQYIYDCNAQMVNEALNTPGRDFIPYIIDLMVQLYCSDNLGNFQYRMLSGILSRPVRQNMLPPDIVEKLLKQSAYIMYRNTNQTQHGGMVTLSKTCVQVLQWDQVDNVLCQLIMNAPFSELPQLLQQSPQNILIVENAFNFINMILTTQQTVTDRFECLLTGLITQLLQINFDLSQTLFQNLNVLMDKEIMQVSNQFELLDTIIIGLSQQPDSKNMYNCFQYALSYIKFVMPRHLQVLQASNNETSIFTLIDSLVSRSTLISTSFACYLMANLIDIANSKINTLSQRIIQRFTPYFIKIFNQDFKVLCNIIKNPANDQDISNYIEPETKRMCLFFISYFFFIFLGTCYPLNDQATITNLHLESQPMQITGVVSIFTASWAMQDSNQEYGSSWRRTLAQYILGSLQPLLAYYGNYISVVWPCLFWARYTSIRQFEINLKAPPQVEFSLLYGINCDLQTLQIVFDNLYSKALVHAQQNDKIDCPFWNRNEASYFGEAIKILSIKYEERSKYIDIIGRPVLLNALMNAIQNLNVTQFPPIYQEYIQIVKTECNGNQNREMNPYQDKWQ